MSRVKSNRILRLDLSDSESYHVTRLEMFSNFFLKIFALKVEVLSTKISIYTHTFPISRPLAKLGQGEGSMPLLGLYILLSSRMHSTKYNCYLIVI